MFTSSRAGALVALTLLPLALSAQGTTAAAPATPDVTVIVTDTMVPHPVSESIASTTVVTAQQIREEGAQTVADALRFVPGVTINQNGSLGAVASASIRGTKSTQVLVLIDGQRINS
jgi:vitamin B12 transporter